MPAPAHGQHSASGSAHPAKITADPPVQAPEEATSSNALDPAPTPSSMEAEWPAAPPGPLPARPNKFSRDIRAHRARWEKLRQQDYVFVVDMPGRMRSFEEAALRVEVREGRVVRADGLRFGGSVPTERAPTMLTIYDTAERAAHHGQGGVPARFLVKYQPSDDVIMSLDVDPSDGVADDETSLRVHCYSTDPDGCRPHDLSQDECRAIDGAVALDRTCAGKFVGRVSGGGACCRASSERISDSSCARAGGNVRWSCEAHDNLLGLGEGPGQACCRPFLAQ